MQIALNNDIILKRTLLLTQVTISITHTMMITGIKMRPANTKPTMKAISKAQQSSGHSMHGMSSFFLLGHFSQDSMVSHLPLPHAKWEGNTHYTQEQV